MHLKQSTAVTIKMGPFVDSVDGNTAETALTISQADIRLTKNGGAYAQTNNAAGATHDEKGNYGVPLDATDTATLGTLRVHIHESGALPVWQDFMVVPANVWDSMFGSDRLDVNIEEWNATSVPAEHTAGYPIVTVKDGTGTGEINTNAGKVVGVELVDVLTTYTSNTPQTGDSFAIVNSGTHGNSALKTLIDTLDNIVDTEVNAIKTVTDQFVFTVANRVDSTAQSGLSTLSVADVRTAVGLASANLDTQLAALAGFIDTEVASILAAVDTEVAAIKAKTDQFVFTVANRVDSTAQSGLSTLTTGDIDARLAAYDGPTNAEMEARTIVAASYATASALTTVDDLLDTEIQAIHDRIGAPVGVSISADIAAVLAALPRRIKKNTALAAFPFLMVDATDHVTAETGLTITATRSIDGGAFGACTNAATEISAGLYKIDLAAADLNGTTITLKFASVGADTRIVTLVTQE